MTKKKFVFILAIAALLAGFMSSRSAASDLSLELPIEANTGIYGDPGERIPVLDIDTPSSLVGLQCHAQYGEENNDSEHPESIIEVVSENTTTLDGVEDFGG